MNLKIYFILALLPLWFGEISAQNNSKDLAKAFAKASADSSYIAVNKKAGWQFLTSYLTPVKTDSVMIEMIVKHDKKTIVWTQDQLVGRIKSINLLPTFEQTLTFSLINNNYKLRIEPNGRCYLRLSSGLLPNADPVIIPVRAVYKR
jgi:hypothetical protein